MNRYFNIIVTFISLLLHKLLEEEYYKSMWYCMCPSLFVGLLLNVDLMINYGLHICIHSYWIYQKALFQSQYCMRLEHMSKCILFIVFDTIKTNNENELT